MRIGKPVDRPDQDETTFSAKPRLPRPGTGYPRGSTQHGLADADIKARTGADKEEIRNTPPAGKWNDIGANE
jgi:hypothetical protein